MAANRRGDLASHSRAVPAASAHTLSKSSAMTGNTDPSSSRLPLQMTRRRIGEAGHEGHEHHDRFRVGRTDDRAVAHRP